MRVAVPRKGQRTPLLHLLLLAVMATLAAGVTPGSAATRRLELEPGPTAEPPVGPDAPPCK